MDIEQIKSLAKQGESTILEFKASTAKLQAAFATICAFLNGKGGAVLIGVNDKGSLIGQDVTDHTRQEIANEIRKIEPSAFIEVQYIELKDKKFLIAIQVNAGDHIPYVYDGRSYQRVQSSTSKMSQHHYEQLLIKRGYLNHSWETFIAEGYTIRDLDRDEIYGTVMDGITKKRIPASIMKAGVEKILRQLDLMVDGKLKNAAFVLFGKNTKPDYSQCWLKMARFRGTEKSPNFIDNQQAYCNVFQMLKEADNFLNKHLPISSVLEKDQFQRIDKFALPVVALREALVNAICHRDYAYRSGYISIAIFDDRVEIWNNGTLPSELKIVDLKRKHDSVLRNELIANTFYLRGYIEKWGTGIQTMIDSCKEHGVAAPKFAERTGGFVVTFKLAELMGGHKIAKRLELTSRQREILKLLGKSQLNSVQLAKELKGFPTARTVQLDLLKLEKAGLVKREGKARAIVWVALKDE